MSYPILAKPARAEIVIRKSRFIARAGHTPDRDAAMALIDAARVEFPDAGHHCWAYLLGAPSQAISASMSDDGEPSGTAGKPILNVLQHKEVGDVGIVVSRYFGGVKLGAGGLVRAYSGAAQAVMEAISVIEHRARRTLVVELDFDQEQHLRYWLERCAGSVQNVDYGSTVHCEVRIDEDQFEELLALAGERGWSIQADEA